MNLSPEDSVEYLFRFIVVASGVITTILLGTAVIRLLGMEVEGPP